MALRLPSTARGAASGLRDLGRGGRRGPLAVMREISTLRGFSIVAATRITLLAVPVVERALVEPNASPAAPRALQRADRVIERLYLSCTRDSWIRSSNHTT